MKNVMRDMFLRFMFNTLKNYMNFIMIYHFENFVAKLHSKIKYVIHIINLQQALNFGLVLKKVHRVIKFNQNTWLKPYIHMNSVLSKKQKMILKKIFFKLINDAVFGRTIKNMRKNRDIKLVTTERRRNFLVSEPNYHTKKFFTENVLAIEMKKKRKILMNKNVYLGLSIQELSKILMYEFCSD